MLMSRLPKNIQDTIKTAIQQNIRRSTSGMILVIIATYVYNLEQIIYSHYLN